MKIKELLEPFIQYKREYVSDSTLTMYYRSLKEQIIPYWGEKERITQEDVDIYISERAKEGMSKRYIDSIFVAFSSMMNWARRKEKISYITKFQKNFPRDMVTDKSKRCLTVAEIKVLQKYCEENFTFDNFCILIILFTGLRNSELCGLQWKNIDLKNNVLKVEKIATRVVKIDKNMNICREKTEISVPKTPNSVRDIPLSGKLQRIFKLLVPLMNPEYYIFRNNPTPLNPNLLRTVLKKIIKECGLPSIRVHDLRHTFATRCVKLGINIKVVSELLGHSNIEVTMKTYLHTDEKEKQEAMQTLSKKLKW